MSPAARPWTPARDQRLERWVEQAEDDGCEDCGGPVQVEEERVFCEDADCGWSCRIPFEEM